MQTDLLAGQPLLRDESNRAERLLTRPPTPPAETTLTSGNGLGNYKCKLRKTVAQSAIQTRGGGGVKFSAKLGEF